MGTVVDILLPMYSTIPMVLVVGVTRVNSAKEEATFGQLQGTRQHALNWSKGKVGHLLYGYGPKLGPVQNRASKIGKAKQEWKLVDLLWNKLKGFVVSGRLDQIKEPTPEVLVPTFRTPPRLVLGLHDGAEYSVGRDSKYCLRITCIRLSITCIR